MESIYGRNQGLWRLVLEAELQDLKTRSPSARKMDMKERRQRSKSITSVEEARRNYQHDDKYNTFTGLNQNIHDEICQKARKPKNEDVDLRLIQKEVKNLRSSEIKNPPVNNNLIKRHKRSKSFNELSSSKRGEPMRNDNLPDNHKSDPNYMKNMFNKSCGNMPGSSRHQNFQSDDFQYDQNYDPNYMNNLFYRSNANVPSSNHHQNGNVSSSNRHQKLQSDDFQHVQNYDPNHTKNLFDRSHAVSSSNRHQNLPNDDFQSDQNNDPNYMRNLFNGSRASTTSSNRHQNLQNNDFQSDQNNDPNYMQNMFNRSHANRTSSKRHKNLQSNDFHYDHTYDPSYMKNLFITSRVKNVNHNPQYRSDIRNIVDHQAQKYQDKSQHLSGVTEYDTSTLDSTLTSYQAFKDKCNRTNIVNNSDSGFSEPSTSSYSQNTSQKNIVHPRSSHGHPRYSQKPDHPNLPHGHQYSQKPDHRRTKSLTSLETSHNSMLGFMNSTMVDDRLSNSSSNNSEFVYNVKQNVITRNPRSKCITNSTRMCKFEVPQKKMYLISDKMATKIGFTTTCAISAYHH